METLPNRDLQRIRRSRRRPRPPQSTTCTCDASGTSARRPSATSTSRSPRCSTSGAARAVRGPAARPTPGSWATTSTTARAANVVSDECLPFDDESFDLVICIEGFYYVADPAQAASEMRRIPEAGGTVLIAVPYVWEYNRTILEHRWTGPELEAVFAGWEHARVVENGGRGVAWATLTGRVIQLKQKSLPGWLRPLTRPDLRRGIRRGQRNRRSDRARRAPSRGQPDPAADEPDADRPATWLDDRVPATGSRESASSRRSPIRRQS